MSFWTQIANLFKGGGGNRDRLLPIYVLSRRCNEPIAGQVDLFNELSRSEDEGDHAYYTRKVLHTSGEKRCFAEVEIQLWLDRNKQVIRHEVEGGRWLEEEEYQAEWTRFHAPPPDDDPQDSVEDNAEDTPASG